MRRLLPALAALALAATPASAQEPMVGEFKLPGGAAVVTAEDHSSKRVVVDTWVGVGSAQDFAGFEGVAAATAHALWHGPSGLLAGARALGGDGSLEVDRDVTHFQLRLPAARLEDGVDLAGRTLSGPDWEKLAIEEALKRLGDGHAAMRRAPEAAAFERFLAANWGPDYGHPVHGEPAGARRIGRAEVRAFFERYYTPGRLRVVLAGDLDTGKAVGMVVRSYAAVLKRTAGGDAPPARGGDREASSWRFEQPMVVAGVRGADVRAPREQAALEMAAQVLAARLGKSLDSPDVGKLVSVRFVRFAGPSPLVVFVAAQSNAVPTVERHVGEAFDALRQHPVRLDEHARAQAAVVATITGMSADLPSRARALGLAATMAGDPHWLRTYPEIVRQVSRQDMLETVQKYAAPDAIKTIILTP